MFCWIGGCIVYTMRLYTLGFAILCSHWAIYWHKMCAAFMEKLNMLFYWMNQNTQPPGHFKQILILLILALILLYIPISSPNQQWCPTYLYQWYSLHLWTGLTTLYLHRGLVDNNSWLNGHRPFLRISSGCGVFVYWQGSVYYTSVDVIQEVEWTIRIIQHHQHTSM